MFGIESESGYDGGRIIKVARSIENGGTMAQANTCPGHVGMTITGVRRTHLKHGCCDVVTRDFNMLIGNVYMGSSLSMDKTRRR